MSKIKKVTRVDSLLPEQEARMAEWRDRWIAIGLKTGPADRPTFERAVAECYRAAKLEPPKRIVWVSSPLVLALAAPIASYLLALRARLDKGGAVDDAVRGAVRGAVGGAVDDAVRGAVRGAVRDAVGGAVGGAPLVAAIRNAIGKAMSEGWWRIMGGQFWVGGSYWWGSPSMVSFFREVCGLELPEPIERAALAYQATAESACWWWPHRDFVMVCERPARLNRDEQGRLHSLSGSAISWPDGWGLHVVNGVRVPEYVVTKPQEITTQAIEQEQNAEIRRVMLERYGLERFLVDSGAAKIHQDKLGELYSRKLGDREYRFVRVLNTTPESDGSHKSYVLSVPAECKTAHEAVAWTFEIQAADYQPVWES